MRNLHVVDNPNGVLTYLQAGKINSGLSFVEGQNIHSARFLMRDDALVQTVELKAQTDGSDTLNGPMSAQVVATATNSAYSGPPRPYVVIAEHTANQAEAQMRANAEMARLLLTAYEVEVTVQGWLTPSGSTYFPYIGQLATLNSPLIDPRGPQLLAIKGVKSTQNSETGTSTAVTLCLPITLGGSSLVNYAVPS